MYLFWRSIILILQLLIICHYTYENEIEIDDIELVGPGLNPDIIVMPARYFYIYFRGRNYTGEKTVNEKDFDVKISGKTKEGHSCRIAQNILNRRDSSFIVRYKLYETCYKVQINIRYKSAPILGSPFLFDGPIQPEDCYCPNKDIKKWFEDYECNLDYNQLKKDLSRFSNVDFNTFYQKAVDRFNNSRQSSVCNYVIKNNKIYRTCYGEHVGFKLFMDEILRSLTRKVVLPDFEFFTNLGDWPLISENSKDKIPMFSWCGSKDTIDIVMPTYDLTQATLQCMGRVSIDMLSVQGNIEKLWSEKEEKSFWRGRDSSRERLKLISIARQHPELFNASLINFFFFRDEEHIYGPKEKRVSFFKFFNYKYQITLDGTVAAYRVPFLLISDSVIFKQNSNYYEHFYNDLTPWVHYIPFNSDLSNLVELLQWAKKNDDKVRKIAKAGRKFAESNLLPQHVFCYHMVLFYEWSKMLISSVNVREGMEHVEDVINEGCDCPNILKDEL